MVPCYGLRDYLGTLHDSLLFFEGQNSGHLPSSQLLNGHYHSAVLDGFHQGVGGFRTSPSIHRKRIHIKSTKGSHELMGQRKSSMGSKSVH
ncbi:hypothetical protein GOP47_0012527 [Adiantum capillus-veneris]|uniref:Uncharacterized protein n=1 Tax=Adiantum capillus-veneris TaxID=13818 RepID=A0A9D4URH8_ADICA|nr:hypothetical protein GOP47_0012527 [Adiantum capillus-veneris]